MTTAQRVSEDQRRQMIADAAYFRAERRGFNGGDPGADWLEAEAEVDARLREMGGKRLLEELDERLAVANGRLRAFKQPEARDNHNEPAKQSRARDGR